MAKNFSDIMSNYQNMSVEELGTSLLSRQAQQQAEAAKAAKKNRKVEQALGVLLAGQAVFKGAFKRRQDELKELKTLDLLNVENDAKKIRGVSDVMSVIPENYFPELNAEERTNKFFADRSLSNQLKNKVKPLVDAQLKSVYANTPNFSATPEYNSILDYGSRQVLLNIFKDNKHDKFYNDLQTLDPSTTNRDELFKSYLSISGQQLTQQKTRLYKEMENQLRQKSGLIGGVKGILQRISGDKEAEGQLGLFSNITEKDIEGANLSEMLDSIDIVGTLMPSIDKAVSMTQLSPTRYRNSAMSQQNKPTRDRIGQIDFVDFMDDVAEDRVLDTFGLLSAVDTSKFEKLNKYFARNPGEKESMVTDATALALRFQDDPQFAVDLYKTVTSDPKKIKQFSSQIRDIEFRNKFALAMTIKAGARPGWRAGASEYIGTDLYMKDLDSQGYDPTLGYNNMTALVEDPIVIDSNGNFKATKDYTQLSNTQKLNIIDKKIDTIINASISEDSKQKTIDNLFDNIDIPEITNQEDYFNYRNKKDQTKDDQVKESLEAEIQKRISELPEETAFMESIRPILPSREERIKRDVEVKEEIKQSKVISDTYNQVEEAVDTLWTGGVGSPFANTKTEIEKNKVKKEESEKIKKYFKDKYEININPIASPDVIKLRRTLKEQPEIANEILNVVEDYKQDKTFNKQIESVPLDINIFEPRSVGQEVTKQAIDAVTFGDSNAATFLNRIALVESDFGTDKNTFKRKDSSGIFQIEKTGAYNEVIRRLDPESDIGSNIKRYNEKIKDAYGIDLSKMSYKDLEQPIVGAAFARAYLLTIPEEIPTDLQEQGEYWKEYYNTILGKGTASRFVREARFKKI